jgi:hypothetical protein
MNRLIVLGIIGLALSGNAYASEKIACNLEPVNDAAGWHYRTKVGGRQARCYYVGERMKPRWELYWAELPAVAPITTDRQPWEAEYRWIDPTGWSQQE